MPHLFDSQVDDAMKDVLKQARDELEADRVQHAEERLSAYEDDGLWLLQNHLAAFMSDPTFKAVQPFLDISQNVYKRIINDVSTIYNAEALRPLFKDGAEIEPVDRWEDLQKMAKMDMTLKTVNRLTNALNTTAVVVAPRRGELSLDVIAASEFAVQTDDIDPTKPISFIYEISQVNTHTVDEGHNRLFGYWDIIGDGHHFILDESGEIVPDGFKENIYKDKNGDPILPVVFFHAEMPRNCFWNHTRGDDLFNAYMNINMLLTWLNFLSLTQSFKQIFIEGAEVAENSIISPLTTLKIYPFGPNAQDGNPQIGTLDLSTDPTGAMQIIKDKIAQIANNWGLSMENFTLSADKSSGIALKLSNSSLNESRRQQIPMYKMWESDLYDVMAIVNNTIKGETDEQGFVYEFDELPVDVEMRLDPAEVKVDVDDREEYEIFRQKQAAGLASNVDWVLRENPDMTRDQAIEHLKMIADERRQLSQNIAPEQTALLGALNQRGVEGEE